MSAKLESSGEGLTRRLPKRQMIERVVDLIGPLAQTGGERTECPARLSLRIDAFGHLAAESHELGVAGQRVHEPRVRCTEQPLAH